LFYRWLKQGVFTSKELPKTFYSTKQQLKIKTNRDKVVASDLTVILMTGFDFTLIKSTWLSIDDIGGLDTGP